MGLLWNKIENETIRGKPGMSITIESIFAYVLSSSVLVLLANQNVTVFLRVRTSSFVNSKA